MTCCVLPFCACISKLQLTREFGLQNWQSIQSVSISPATRFCLLMQVSGSGDILYALPSNFKQVIAGKSWLLRAEPFLQKLRDASAYLVRVSFGTALITSVVLVWLTILAILSSGSRDDDNRRLVGPYLALSSQPLPLQQSCSSFC